MTDKEKEKIANLVKGFVCSYCDCTYKHIIKALDRIDKISVYSKFFERDAKYKDSICIDSDKLFALTIDESIKYLQEIKSKGYTQIEEKWCGYDDNYFVASRYTIEPEEKYEHRISSLIIEYVFDIMCQEDKINKKRKQN